MVMKIWGRKGTFVEFGDYVDVWGIKETVETKGTYLVLWHYLRRGHYGE